MKPEQKKDFKKHMGLLFKELKEKLNLKRTPKVVLVEDKENARKTLGGTGSYDKENEVIRLYITDRHPKDILRTMSHELIHHEQNENGKLNSPSDKMQEADPRYAQNDPILREAEKDAYLRGCLMFRDFEDRLKNE